MNTPLALGSLFDGSGGFPLGAVINGIHPLWASEIEPFPIRVTTKRMPWMQHLGDISRISGTDIEPVDIITFGSPCTDMSVAGKRAGLDGKQSVLFYEAIRIVREMREATHGEYPRFIVWENVPGAFSSNKGEDFRAVLSSIVQIAEPSAEVPAPENNAWPYADILVGDGWSVAYRTVDAQYFGVAQRRRRIYLVADFGSERAGEVLFEREGVSRDFTPGFSPWEGIAGYPAGSAGAAIAFEPGAASRLGGHCWEEFTGALRAHPGDNQTAVAIEHHPSDSRIKISGDGIVQTLSGRMGTGGNNVPLTLKIHSGCDSGEKGELIRDNQSETLSCSNDQTLFIPKAYGICSKESNSMKSNNPLAGFYEVQTARTIDQSGGNPACNQGGIAICVQGSMIGRDVNNGPCGKGVNEEVSYTLDTTDRHAVAYAMTTGEFTQVYKEQSPCLQARDYKDPPVVGMPQFIVRRLTPTECARLQGFPDGWCAGLETHEPTESEVSWWADVFETHRRIMGTSSKPRSKAQIIKWLKNPYSDSAEYKLWGNGVALPCVCFALRGIMELIGMEQHKSA